MNPRPPMRALMVAGLLVGLAACTPPPSADLAIRNDSDETFYVRLEGAKGSAPESFRVDPGAYGRAVAPGVEQPATRLVVFSATCDTVADESSPQLGSMDIDRGGSLSFNVGMSRIESWMDVLPPDEACG
jgi:hypothetical protein